VNRRELLVAAALAPLLSRFRSALAAEGAPTALPDAAAISAAQRKLSRRVIEALSKDGATVVISPASIAGAFSVISAGASPELVRAIGAMLGFADTVTAADALAAVTKALGQAQGEASALAMARALVLDPALKSPAPTLSGLRAGGVEVIGAAFDDPATLKRINAWVAAKTKDLIPVLLDELPAQPGLVALDALHFKDRWKRQFEAGETSARPFHSAGDGIARGVVALPQRRAVHRGRPWLPGGSLFANRRDQPRQAAADIGLRCCPFLAGRARFRRTSGTGPIAQACIVGIA
jgi:serpin B